MLDRIKRFIETQNMSASAFANAIGVQRSSVSHILSGRNKPSLDFILRLKNYYPDLNLDWLLFGKGPILSTKKTDVENSISEIDNDKKTFPAQKNESRDKDLFTKYAEFKEEILGENKTIGDDIQDEVLPQSAKRIKKIVLFFEDNSFEEYNPGK
ncbi:MAG: transcriptional regulator [Marinilabiliales bacterium]|nr:MAG: transcriptional regulator [Marinilabiliales bacterium]